ncbi:hypothetical protein F4780DRAFT_24340 [Xylariomycetidae sp. FL0641]|nr:hypothetical protein F4780DRAFT_24340 [Xylariomycetidae sp. FL0641]
MFVSEICHQGPHLGLVKLGQSRPLRHWRWRRRCGHQGKSLSYLPHRNISRIRLHDLQLHSYIRIHYYTSNFSSALETVSKKPTTTIMDNWLNRQVQNGVACVGRYAGNTVNMAGTSVASAGRSAGNTVIETTRGWGDTVKNYGNSVKDSTKASGPRAPTTQNPLGVRRAATTGGSSGKSSGRGNGYYGTRRAQTAKNPLGL